MTASDPKRPSNRLIHEKSPYLLQHAHNPVDWWPWCDEAFEKAKREDKPVLLSIGYATCHWCHVMERESFEDEDTAATLNRLYVAIKVDREERPDVDQIYMRALQATGQHGGWPLNMFLTPDRLPMTGGTYFPPQPAYGRPSFIQILESIHGMWTNERQRLLDSANVLFDFLKQNQRDAEENLPAESAFSAAYEHFSRHYDDYRGGFVVNGPNKFPPSMSLLFLLERYRRTGETRALAMVEGTLDHMKRGGIYDQIGGGLSRYSTDHDWLVPHFEKMLYDNALFAWALVECFRVTKNERYRGWALDVFEYVRRDMTAPDGAFYSAEDADSEGEEGKFYVWTLDEINQALKEAGVELDDRKLLLGFWGVTSRGNFEGKSILFEMQPREQFLAGVGRPAADFDRLLERARAGLRMARDKRVRPLRDDKTLTSWNALMITALAQAARAFDQPELATRAARAAEFIWSRMRDDKGRLLRRYRDGEARFDGGLADYALLGCAFLDLYRANFQPEHLARAAELARTVHEHFAAPGGAYYDSAGEKSDLIIRAMDAYDGVEPSGVSAAARLFYGLSLYGVDHLENRNRAESIFRYFGSSLETNGPSHSFSLYVYSHLRHGAPEIAVVAPEKKVAPDSETARILAWIGQNLDSEVAVAAASADAIAESAAIVPLLQDRTLLNGGLAAYVCRERACERPVGDLSALQTLLGPASAP